MKNPQSTEIKKCPEKASREIRESENQDMNNRTSDNQENIRLTT
jgi:hypothetical protein